MHSESMKTTSLFSFALVVCRHPDGRFLLVQEFANQGFWLPGGAVDPEESLMSAARRETKEEAGLDVELTGIIRIQHTARDGYVRLRVIFLGRPVSLTQLPKSIPDYESVGAAWVTYEEMQSLRLRGSEPLIFCGHVFEGKEVYPLSLLDDKGT
jgi:8-oxo-dGTP pyrophosphatase MutT (NUDIX family)